jgi:tRNA(Arg) A34 adenosine deaminase TadA
MALAVAAAGENVARGTGGPFGAVVRDDVSGEVIGVGVNLAMSSGNPVLHAETVAISLAGRRLETGGALTLFTSCEPCIMCLGAAHWAQIRRIVSAASRQDAESVGFSEGAGTPQLRAEMASRGVVFEDGLLRDGSTEVLRAYAGQGGVIYGPKS